MQVIQAPLCAANSIIVSGKNITDTVFKTSICSMLCWPGLPRAGEGCTSFTLPSVSNHLTTTKIDLLLLDSPTIWIRLVFYPSTTFCTEGCFVHLLFHYKLSKYLKDTKVLEIINSVAESVMIFSLIANDMTACNVGLPYAALNEIAWVLWLGSCGNMGHI